MNFKKPMIAFLALTVSMTQTGCVAGLVTGNPGLVWPGATMGVLGAIAQMKSGGHPVSWFVMVTGIALDEKNPGRQESLNVLPLHEDVAQRLNADLEELETYNDELPQVLAANQKAEEGFRLLSFEKVDVDALQEVVRDLGFDSYDELEKILSGESVTCSDLSRFAKAQGLSESTARIYLNTRFGIKVAKGC